MINRSARIWHNYVSLLTRQNSCGGMGLTILGCTIEKLGLVLRDVVGHDLVVILHNIRVLLITADAHIS